MFAIRTLRNRPLLLALALLFAAAATVTAPGPATAVDTEEVYDRGASDLDFYLSADGLGLERDDASLSAEFMLGYGLLPWMSGMVGIVVDADAYLTRSRQIVYGALFATPVDTDHVDFDLRLDVRTDGESLVFTPAFELNLDAAPDMAAWGFFLLGGAAVYGTRDPLEGDPQIRTTLEATLGGYVTIGGVHQILLAIDVAILPDAGDGERLFDVGGIGLGYNVTLSEAFELVTELRFDIPLEEDHFSIGATGGFIVTMP